jgi:hypothetical protein
MEMPDAKLLTKDDVNYRVHEKCNTCNYFYYPNTCEKINGNISPDAVCDKWEIKPKKEPMDGMSYKAEYDKAQG